MPSPHRTLKSSTFRRVRRALLGKPIYATNGALHDPFFIIGSGRSGTTLLRRILCSNPEVHIPPEMYIQEFVRAYDKHSRVTWREFVHLILAGVQFRHNHHPYSFHALAQHLIERPKDERSLATIIAAIAAYDAQEKGIAFTRWGDKTPRNVYAMKEILLMFPDARFIHSYRDGCDVVQSFVNSGFGTYEEAAHTWVDSIQLVDAFPQPERVYSLRYEDLATTPERYAREVCEFLDIDFSPEMLDVNEKAKSATSEEARLAHHQDLHAPISTDTIGSRRAEIPKDTLQKLAPIMDPSLLKLGYKACLDTD